MKWGFVLVGLFFCWEPGTMNYELIWFDGNRVGGYCELRVNLRKVLEA